MTGFNFDIRNELRNIYEEKKRKTKQNKKQLYGRDCMQHPVLMYHPLNPFLECDWLFALHIGQLSVPWPFNLL